MQQSPSRETKSSSASQEIPHILWKPNVHYRVHKTHPPVPILSHMNSIYFNFNIILPSKLVSSKCFLALSFPSQNPLSTSLLPYDC